MLFIKPILWYQKCLMNGEKIRINITGDLTFLYLVDKMVYPKPKMHFFLNMFPALIASPTSVFFSGWEFLVKTMLVILMDGRNNCKGKL